MRRTLAPITALLAASLPWAALAAVPPTAGAEPAAGPKHYTFTLDGNGRELDLATGVVQLGDKLAQVTVPPGFGYLSPADTETFLTEVWGNPPAEKLGLGMLLPLDVNPRGDDGWAVVLAYEDAGHVTDSDANEIDYDKLLADKQKDEEEENAERTKAGYSTLHLAKWATPPRYDMKSRKLYWAEDLEVGGRQVHTLNYFVRVLGREGYLVLNAVADMPALAAVSKHMETVIPAVEFAPQQRYETFDPTTGRIAAAGIAGLVAGKVAAKAGLFVMLAAAGKKVIALAIMAGASMFRRLFGRRKDAQPALATASGPAAGAQDPGK